jgi:mono/diheme cytochrome c family protein
MKRPVKILLTVIIIAIVIVGGIGAFLAFALPNVGPPPKISVEPLPQKITRGKYLVNSVAACMTCHTRRDFSFFSGPVDSSVFGAGGEQFDKSMVPGSLYTTNITPYKLQDWSDGEIYRAITAGVKRDGSAIFPIMPYTKYGNMDPRDVHSMIAYLRTLNPVEKEVPASKLDFPMNMLMNAYPLKQEEKEMPDSANTVEYGKYLVNIANCVQCHSQKNLYDLEEGTEFGGGQLFKLPAGDVYSANITPDDATGIGKWSKTYFIQQFKQYSDSTGQRRKIEPGNFNSPMPWVSFSTMTEHDLSAIYDYLRTVKPKSNKVEKWKKR